MKKILIIPFVLFLSLGLFAQGKVFLEPYLGFFVGYSKENKAVNSKQKIINHYHFGFKDLALGGKISYKTDKSKFAIGYELSFYTSGYKHIETGLPRIEWYYSSSSIYFNSLYVEYARQLISFNVKMPQSLKKWVKGDNENLYLFASKISPVLGLEYRFSGFGFKNDYNDPHAIILTSQGNYFADVEYLHLYKETNFNMRGGVNWEFYNGERHKFTLIFLYKFAFKDAGYTHYHFKSVNNRNPEFDYQNTTKGNGFCIYFGIPIKLYTFKKK